MLRLLVAIGASILSDVWKLMMMILWHREPLYLAVSFALSHYTKYCAPARTDYESFQRARCKLEHGFGVSSFARI